MVFGQPAEVRDHGHEHAFQAFVVERAGKVVVIDEKRLAIEALDDRDHVSVEESD